MLFDAGVFRYQKGVDSEIRAKLKSIQLGF